jgi:hypothetical protein
MTPLASWALFLVCVVVGVGVYLVVAGGRRYRRMERAWVESLPPKHPRAERPDPTLWVHVRPSVYDWQTHGDFDHDPLRDHEWCDGCATLLRGALNRIGDRHMGPRSADDLVAAIREELEP